MAAAPSVTTESQGYGASGGAISGSETRTKSLLEMMKVRASKPQTPRPEMKAIRVSVNQLTVAVKTGELMLVRDFNVRALDANTRVAIVMLMEPQTPQNPQKSSTGKPVPVPVIGSAFFGGNVFLNAEEFQTHKHSWFERRLRNYKVILHTRSCWMAFQRIQSIRFWCGFCSMHRRDKGRAWADI